MRHSLAGLVVLLVTLAACSDNGQQEEHPTVALTNTTTPTTETTTSQERTTLVAGEVTTAEEAFCAGFISSVSAEPGSLIPEWDDLRFFTFQDCLDLGLAEVVPEDALLHRAFVFGCAAVLTHLQSGQALPEDVRFRIAEATCQLPWDFTHPEYEGWEARITRDGVCYLGGEPPCLDETGNPIEVQQ